MCIPTKQLKLICKRKRWGKLCLDEIGKHHFHFQWFLLGSLGAQCEVLTASGAACTQVYLSMVSSGIMVDEMVKGGVFSGIVL